MNIKFFTEASRTHKIQMVLVGSLMIVSTLSLALFATGPVAAAPFSTPTGPGHTASVRIILVGGSDLADTMQDTVDRMVAAYPKASAPDVILADWRSEGPLAFYQSGTIYVRADLAKVLAPGAMVELLAHEVGHHYMEELNVIVGYDKRIATHGDVEFVRAVDALMAGVGERMIWR